MHARSPLLPAAITSATRPPSNWITGARHHAQPTLHIDSTPFHSTPLHSSIQLHSLNLHISSLSLSNRKHTHSRTHALTHSLSQSLMPSLRAAAAAVYAAFAPHTHCLIRSLAPWLNHSSVPSLPTPPPPPNCNRQSSCANINHHICSFRIESWPAIRCKLTRLAATFTGTRL